MSSKNVECDLFPALDTRFQSLQPRMDELCKKIVKDLGLPDRSVLCSPTIGKGEKTKGRLISLTVSVAEPSSPFAFDEKYDSLRAKTPIVSLSASDTKDETYCELTVEEDVIKIVGEPQSRKRSEAKDKKVTYRIDIVSSELLEYVNRLCRYKIEHYKSTASEFGCCDLYKECSEAGHCLHVNKLFATACQYKRNLDDGRNFYA